MKYLVIEIQTDATGSVATLVTQRDDLNEALSTYYTVLASAAISTLPHHAATLITNEGIQLLFQDFAHEGGPK